MVRETQYTRLKDKILARMAVSVPGYGWSPTRLGRDISTERESYESGTISPILQRLEKEGLVERIPFPSGRGGLWKLKHHGLAEAWEVEFITRDNDVVCHIVIKAKSFSARGFGETKYRAMMDAIAFLMVKE